MSRFLHRPARRAFTLLEVLIAVGVIILLVGLTVTAATSFVEQSEIKRTEAALRVIDMAIQEWETAAERPITWGYIADHPEYTFDLSARTSEVLITTELAQLLTRQTTARGILARLEPDLLFTYQLGEFPRWARTSAIQYEIEHRFLDEIAILDAWGTPIYTTHPGHALSDAAIPAAPEPATRDPDGTIRTPNEARYGIARNRKICLVSAGPDRLFGLQEEFPQLSGDALARAIAKARKDNIFSYRPVFVEELESPPADWYGF